MPKDTVTIEGDAPCEEVFDFIHDYGRWLDWDTLLIEATILGDAEEADVGVRTRCVGTRQSGWLALKTAYVSFRRGEVATVKLVNRPPFFEQFSATIRHEPLSENRSRVIYIYSFEARPWSLRWVLEPVMNFGLRRETRKRLDSLKSHYSTP